ncbi:MAG: DUF4174 domain-containing protein [Bacteroidia bacterium]|nr:DUF4174 domain-containing protein [Bacteroidia bacterium]
MKAQRSLANFRWKNRLVLIHSTHNDPKAQNQLDNLLKLEKELEDRDMVILFLDSQLKTVEVKFGSPPLPLDYAAILDEYKLDPYYLYVVLVGKDGGAKMHKNRVVDPWQIFALIDKMPMRRAEMENEN